MALEIDNGWLFSNQTLNVLRFLFVHFPTNGSLMVLSALSKKVNQFWKNVVNLSIMTFLLRI